jgi:tRNA pseudouridine13 synthase
MKVKVLPEDFIVKELLKIPLRETGAYTILELCKKHWNTLDAIDYAARKLSVPKKNFSRAGLKDRHSLSTQYLSVKGCVRTSIREKNISIKPVGMADKELAPTDLTGNSFTITLRDLTDGESANIRNNYADVHTYGVPNYFDEQRFGSARHGRGFFAKKLLLRHYSGALKTLLCYPHKDDRRKLKEFKSCCLKNWGQWNACMHTIPHGYKKILAYLRDHPRAFKNAIKCIDRELLNLYLLSYQSFLFNETVKAYMENTENDLITIPYSAGNFVFYRRLENTAVMQGVKIPMIHHKMPLTDPVHTLALSVLEKEGVCLKDFSLNKMRFRNVRFKQFERPLIVRPEQFSIGTEKDDDLYKGKKKICVKFVLPSGAYATLIVKRLSLRT